MKNEELKNALRLITKVQADPRVGADLGDQLMKAKRELEAVSRSGKSERQRLCLAIENVATVMLQIVESTPGSE